MVDGLGAGDRVALLLPGSQRYLDAVLALLADGVVPIPLDPRLTAPGTRTPGQTAVAVTNTQTPSPSAGWARSPTSRSSRSSTRWTRRRRPE